jgi:hypothetical protein
MQTGLSIGLSGQIWDFSGIQQTFAERPHQPRPVIPQQILAVITNA